MDHMPSLIFFRMIMFRQQKDRSGGTPTQEAHADPLSRVISEAVERAIDGRLQDIVAAIRETMPLAQTNNMARPSDERFVSMRQLEKILCADRSTIRRRSIRGIYPPLRKFGASVGYFQSDLDIIFSTIR
jgi:predicted DNA-binding transcriptional regulator AlpA